MENFTVRATLAFGECRMFIIEADDLIGAAIKGQEVIDEVYRRIKLEVDDEPLGEPHICEISESPLITFSKEWLDGYVEEVRETIKEHEED